MKIDEFYRECEDILGVKTKYKEQKLYNKVDRETGEIYKVPTRATRWGGREPGNGRFPGRGMIRVFGSTIHVSLRDPVVSGIFSSFEDVLVALRASVEDVVEKPEPQVGDEIDVYIGGEFKGRGTIIDDYDESQWNVKLTLTYPNGHSAVVNRFVDKDQGKS